MCKVVIENPNSKKGFIVFNHLYSRESGTFTTKELLEELKRYGLNMTEGELQNEINMLIEDGVVSQRVGCYQRMAML